MHLKYMNNFNIFIILLSWNTTAHQINFNFSKFKKTFDLNAVSMLTNLFAIIADISNSSDIFIVLVLDGNSELIAQAWIESGILLKTFFIIPASNFFLWKKGRFRSQVQICSALPSAVSTMDVFIGSLRFQQVISDQ